jgi:predicted Zn-dependent protease with MMP-like domain
MGVGPRPGAWPSFQAWWWHHWLRPTADSGRHSKPGAGGGAGPNLVSWPALWYGRHMDPPNSIDGSSYEAIDEFLARFDELVATDPHRALSWLDEADAVIREQGVWVMCRAEALKSARGVEVAIAYLEEIVVEEPGYADAHHALAELQRDVGNERAAVRHHLETLRADLAADSVSEPISDEVAMAIAREAARVVADLPAKIRGRMLHLPVLIQARPSARLVEDGVDSRSLGLFEGPNLADVQGTAVPPEPTRITLFTHCLVDAFGDDEEALLEQVRITVLHEIGHYFCLDEEQLAELGLD